MDHKHSTACSLKMIAFEPLRDTRLKKIVELKNTNTSSEIQSCLDLNEVTFIVLIYLCFQVNSFTWEGFYSDFGKIWKMTNNKTLRGKRGIKFDFWRSLCPKPLNKYRHYENETLVETVVFHKRDKNLQVQNTGHRSQVTGHRSQVQIIAQLINNWDKQLPRKLKFYFSLWLGLHCRRQV